jgi:hypothetical protein
MKFPELIPKNPIKDELDPFRPELTGAQVDPTKDFAVDWTQLVPESEMGQDSTHPLPNNHVDSHTSHKKT